MIKKAVLAYSGGLDTSIILKWLQEQYKCEVVTFTADLGQQEEIEPARERAASLGVVEIFIEDLREEFARDYIFPMFRANAVYEGEYLLGTSIARPLIAKRLVEIAESTGADAISHGATGKGNDQVRFDVSVGALAPDLEILAPVREWELTTRASEIVFARAHKIPITVSEDKQYSGDENRWGRSIEAGELEDPWAEPKENVWEWTLAIEDAPDDPTYVDIRFERGVPVSLDGERMEPVVLILRMHELAGQNGVGRIDMVENRLVGIKSRETYEAPAAVVLMEAHRALESAQTVGKLVLDTSK